MRPAQFDYTRAASVSEALDALKNTSGAKVIAGGHSLIPPMNLRLSQPDMLVDISRIAELKGIRIEGGALLIGATTTHAEIARSAEVQEHAPALAYAASRIGDPQVRNWGTIGGNIAHADPASDPPTVLLAYGANVHVVGASGARVIPAAEFFIDLFTTALGSGEIVTGVELPLKMGRHSAYLKMAHPASRYAVVGVAVVLEMEGDTCISANVAVGGAVSHATLSPSASTALVGTKLDDAALDAAAAGLKSDIGDAVMGDLFAPEHYRREMAGVYLKRAVRAALA